MSEALEVAGCIAADGRRRGGPALRRSAARAAGLVLALGIALALVLGEGWDELADLRDRPAAFAGGNGRRDRRPRCAGRDPAPLAPAAAAGPACGAALPDPDRRRRRGGREPAGAALRRDRRRRPRRRRSRRSGADGPVRDSAAPGPGARSRLSPLYAVQAALLQRRRLRDAQRRVLPGPVRGHVLAARRGPLDAAPARARASRWSSARSLLFAAIGIGQHIAGEIFWNDALEMSNDFHFYFRVNSLFWDPNIYGRYLALAIVLAAGVLVWLREPRRALAAGGGDRRAVRWPAVRLLADELHRPARGHRGARRPPLEPPAGPRSPRR